ncbi:MAG: glycosyltransferase [Pseudomonadota bacterium]
MSGESLRVGLVVPTLNAGPAWPDWIEALKRQTRYPDRVVVIDSSSTDDTRRVALGAGLEVVPIPAAEFDHGATRQQGVDLIAADVSIALFLTQDAELADPHAIEQLLAVFADPAVACAYGRQLARSSHSAIARHHRSYNYSNESRCVDKTALSSEGLRAAFCSNSFAAYRIDALNDVGGFPSPVVYGEDMLAALKLLQAGYRKCYVPSACVWHAHDYTLRQEFRRYFDMGVMHSSEPALETLKGQASSTGRAFVKSEIRTVAGGKWATTASLIFRNGMRYLGYQLGKRFKQIPKSVSTAMSMNPRYFSVDGRRS